MAFGPDAFITKVRNSVGFHYRQADIKELFERALVAGKVEGSLVICAIGGLSRYTMTDVLAIRLVDEAAGADLGAGGGEFSRRGEEVVDVAQDLTWFVDSLVASLLRRHGTTQRTRTTIDVPPLLTAAHEAAEKARGQQQRERPIVPPAPEG